jgi:hypothetical protein
MCQQLRQNPRTTPHLEQVGVPVCVILRWRQAAAQLQVRQQHRVLRPPVEQGATRQSLPHILPSKCCTCLHSQPDPGPLSLAPHVLPRVF